MIIHKISTPVECRSYCYKTDIEHVITVIEMKLVEKVSWEFSSSFPFIRRNKYFDRVYKISQVIPYYDDSDYDSFASASNRRLRTVANKDKQLAELWLKENRGDYGK